ncbi:MAG: MoaD/ThiS family protein [Thermoleophilia bacterium]
MLELESTTPPVEDGGVLNLVVQGQSFLYRGEPDIGSLLESRGENMLYVNVRINDQVLDTREFKQVPVKEGDRIDFLYFMGGGIFVQPDRRRD